jgi:type IX secretion system PorP/SprF family membrane protein
MKHTVLFLAGLIPLCMLGQSNMRINNYWANPYYINPAYINEKAPTTFSTVARKQWFGVPGAPSTIYGTATLWLDELNTQFGVKLLSDKIGLTQTTQVALSYAYALTLNQRWKLEAGIAASYQNLSYDLSMVEVDKPEISGFYSNLMNENFYNCDLGFQFTSKELVVGGSSQNFISLFYAENLHQITSNFLYGYYQRKNDEMIELRYGMSAIQYRGILQMEFSLLSCFKYYQVPELLQVGLFYRTRSEMGVLMGYNLTPQFHLWYSFDFNVGGLSRSSIGTHEVMLVYKLKKLCKNCREWRGL